MPRHHGGGRRRHHGYRPIVSVPYYNYGYPYWYDDYYDRNPEPNYVVIKEPSPAPQATHNIMSSYLPQVATAAATLFVSYLLWGRR